MKRKIVLVIATLGILSAMPAFASHQEMTKDQQMLKNHEGAQQCVMQAETIQEKIRRIQGEIKQGSDKYSAEDLKKLEGKLKEANDLLDNLGKR